MITIESFYGTKAITECAVQIEALLKERDNLLERNKILEASINEEKAWKEAYREVAINLKIRIGWLGGIKDDELMLYAEAQRIISEKKKQTKENHERI